MILLVTLSHDVAHMGAARYVYYLHIFLHIVGRQLGFIINANCSIYLKLNFGAINFNILSFLINKELII